MVDADAIKDRVLGNDEKSIEQRVKERYQSLSKNRIYVDSEEDVPDQYTAQTSDRGAVYYETDSGSGGGSESVDDVLEDEFGSEVADEYQQRVNDGMDERDAAVETLVDVGLASEDSEAEEMLDYMEENLNSSDG